MKPFSLIASLLFAITFAAEAGNGFECKYDGNQQEMNACAVRDYKAADDTLNQRYKAVMSSLSSTKQKALREQQRAWLKKRDPACKEAVKLSEGGSIWPLEYYSCLEVTTKQRVEEIEQWQISQ